MEAAVTGGACTVAIRVTTRVAWGALEAVVLRIVLRRARSAICAGPLVAARAGAFRKGVSSDTVRVARAVGGCCTGQVALGVRVVRRLARTAVGRGIEGVGASVARVACVVVAACTLA